MLIGHPEAQLQLHVSGWKFLSLKFNKNSPKSEKSVDFSYNQRYNVSAKYSCGFSDFLVSSIIVGERYLDYFITITEDRL